MPTLPIVHREHHVLKSTDEVDAKHNEAILDIERNPKIVKSIASFPYILDAREGILVAPDRNPGELAWKHLNAAMKDALVVYTRAHDQDCETSKQRVDETRAPIATKPGQPARSSLPGRPT